MDALRRIAEWVDVAIAKPGQVDQVLGGGGNKDCVSPEGLVVPGTQPPFARSMPAT